MPAPPSLSTIERRLIAEAAQLQAAGAKVRWRAAGLRLVWIVDRKEHQVFTCGSQRSFAALCRAAEEYYRVEAKGKCETFQS